MKTEYSFLPTLSNGSPLGSSDMQSFVNIMTYILDNGLYNMISDEAYMHGFNENSGNVYVYLENGVTVASSFGQSPVFYVTDDNDDGYDGEHEFETYREAIEYINRDKFGDDDNKTNDYNE